MLNIPFDLILESAQRRIPLIDLECNAASGSDADEVLRVCVVPVVFLVLVGLHVGSKSYCDRRGGCVLEFNH